MCSMSAELWRASACEGKKSFDSFERASKAAGRRRNRNAYHCRFCGKSHVGFIDRQPKPYRRPQPRRDEWTAE